MTICDITGGRGEGLEGQIKLQIPRNLYCFTYLICLLLSTKLLCLGRGRFLLNMTAVVLFVEIVSPHSIHHFDMLFIVF